MGIAAFLETVRRNWKRRIEVFILVSFAGVQVDKAGATVLFEEPNKGSGNNAGVVVNPVRLGSLGEFGSAEFVADKLIQAEKRKVSSLGFLHRVYLFTGLDVNKYVKIRSLREFLRDCRPTDL